MYKSRSGAYAANNVAANTDITNLLLPATAAKISITAFEIRCSTAARIQVNDKDVIQCAPAKNGLTGYVARVNLNKKFFVGIEKIEILDACDLTLNYFYHIVHASVAAPVFSLPTGAVESGTVLSLNSATLDAAIIYTINGEQAVYTAPITLTETATITAYAIKDGYVSATSTATYIVNGTVNKVPYNFRQSPAGIGNVMIDKIIGGTIAHNQFVKNGNFASASDWTPMYGSLSVSNNKGTYTRTESSSSSRIQQNIVIPKDHICFISATVTSSANTEIMWGINTGSIQYAAPYTTTANVRVTYTSLIKPTGISSVVYFYNDRQSQGAVGDTVIYENAMVSDLNLMFGSTIADYVYSLETATAGAGVAWLKAHGFFTEPYYAYNAGELMSVNTSAHNMRGFNQFDKDTVKTSAGNYIINDNGQQVADGSSSYFVEYTRVLPNTKYFMFTRGLSGGYQRMYFYDADKNFISRSNTLTDTEITMPVNCHYVRFQYKRVGVDTSLWCLNISDPSKNGTYEPYHLYSYPLDDTLTLNGLYKLDADNKLYCDGDTYESDGTVTRKYGIVDLGSLSWTYATSLFSADLANAKTNGDGICLLYTRGTGAVPSDKQFQLFAGGIIIADSAYSDAAAFTTAMSGVYLVYELATPTTETADPFTNPQTSTPNGTEEYVDAGVEAETRDVAIPVGHETLYS